MRPCARSAEAAWGPSTRPDRNGGYPRLTAALERALGRLPEDYREVLLLRYQGDLSFEEIGRRLGRSANAARKLWLRALHKLEQELEAPP